MPRIIIVEDDPMIAEIYQKKFQSSGFEAAIATSGKDVLRIAKEGVWDLILLDMMMAEMSGLEALKVLKGGEYDAHTKVYMFTSLDDKESQDKAFAAGADGYLVKPRYTPSQLVEEMQRLFNQSVEAEKNGEKRIAEEQIVPAANGLGKRILFIEDEDIFLEIFGKKLQDDGYSVELAKNGAWGMKEVMDKNFDLIIMDVVMPSMTGREILERLRLEEKTKDIPVVVLSASAADDDLQAMEKMGITKSFVKTHIVPSDLSKEVAKILK